MKNTATTRESPLCPKCGSERVGFSETSEEEMVECRLCDPWHLFEPPEHMKGKGTPKNPSNKRLDIAKRRKRDQFYWYLNDVLVEYSPGPRTFRQWRKDYPDTTIQQWAERTEIALYLDVDKIKEGWLRYFRSPWPEETLKELSDPENVRSLFKEESPKVVDEVLLEKFGLAIVKPLLSQKHAPLDLSNLPDWLNLKLIITVVWQITGEELSKESIRKLPLESDPEKHKGKRKRDSVFEYCDYKLPEKN